LHVPGSSDPAASLAAALRGAITNIDSGAQFLLARVPCTPPRTQHQMQAWARHWPCALQSLGTCVTPPVSTLNSNQLQAAHAFMRQALQEALRSGEKVGAVLVSPAGEVLAC